MNKNLLWIIATVGALSVSSCTAVDGCNDDCNGYLNGEEATVEFFVSPQGRSAATRAAGDRSDELVHYPDTLNNEFPQISDGTKAHLLIYAVYDNGENNDGVNPRLLEHYGEGVSAAAAAKLPAGYEAGEGQTVLYIEEFPTPEPIRLRLMRNQTYNIAFWAQNVDCEAYDTKDLTKVKVNYASAKNNDELRDAFCKVEQFSIKGDGQRDVVLVRPLAQINVGTSGYDYEYAVYGADDPNYLYSRISLTGVAQYLDVVGNKVLGVGDGLSEDEATVTVEYGYGRIPAYVNYGDIVEEGKKLLNDDEDPDELGEAAIIKRFISSPRFPEDRTAWRTYEEQFLRVQLDENADYSPYVSYSDPDGSFDKDTEVFKYLSMCYVLVPYHDTESGTYGTTVESVNVWIAEDAAGTSETHIITDLSNVPVQRNWRTNILGKAIIHEPYAAHIHIYPDYQGDYNDDDFSNGHENPDYTDPDKQPDHEGDASEPAE